MERAGGGEAIIYAAAINAQLCGLLNAPRGCFCKWLRGVIIAFGKLLGCIFIRWGWGVGCALSHNYKNRDMGDISTRINGWKFIEKSSYLQVMEVYLG